MSRLEAVWAAAIMHWWSSHPEGYGKGKEHSQDPKIQESKLPALQGVSQKDLMGNGPQGQESRTELADL